MTKPAAASLVVSMTCIICAGSSLHAAPVFVMRGSAAGPASFNAGRGTALTSKHLEPPVAATSRFSRFTSGAAGVLRGAAATAAGAGKSIAGRVSGGLGSLGDRLKVALRGSKSSASADRTLKGASTTGASKKTRPDLGKPSHVEKKIEPIKLSSVSFAKKLISSRTSFAQGILDKYMGPPGKTGVAVLKANAKDLTEAKVFRQKAAVNYAKAHLQWQAGEKSGRARYAGDRQIRAAERREWRVAKREREQFLRERRAELFAPIPKP